MQKDAKILGSNENKQFTHHIFFSPPDKLPLQKVTELLKTWRSFLFLSW